MDNANKGDSVSTGNQFAGFVGKLAISTAIIFKLQQASPEAGQLATPLTYIHHPSENTPTTINAILC